MAMIALGVCGGIGAYKSVEVVRGLQKQGHDVVAVMTRSATQFVGELTFEAITRHRVLTSQFEPGANADRLRQGYGESAGASAQADIEHISLASGIDLLLVAPATANIIGKFANGIADDFLTSLYLATKAPVLMAPAMNTHMLEHQAVQRNLDVLAGRGVRFVDPGAGYLACGWIGRGRLAEPADIVAAAGEVLSPSGPLKGRTVIVTAGPTREALDPVRFVGNRSSGRMGYAMAVAARNRGARVVLVSGPTELPAPADIETIRVTTAAEMREATISRAAQADVVIMAAAVADYTPAGTSNQKIHKNEDTLTLTLVRTPDILGELGRLRAGSDRPLLVGFAAETTDVVDSARRKRREKGVDLVVANDVSRADAGFEVDTNEVTVVSASGEETLPLQSKAAIAAQIIDRIETLLRSRTLTASRAEL
ncbi:MAG: bifunctional phosphopantothenoylcysteine decarboxylase/phosphopantothenate--cysteine ligase CoaBC [Acidobacteria bacterium]|nr:bifunctional phosphopantothenoylcysteine decarboxylase/phosphopantothenate--cysteine ligase CoaBC [Acidobacteriota bacterium]